MTKYVQEQDAWDRFVQDRLGEDAILVHVSQFSSDSRVYRAHDSMFKIRRLTPASIRGRTNSFEDEALILQHVSSVSGVPAVRSYARIGEWEQLELAPLPEICGYDPSFGRPLGSFKEFWSLVQVMKDLNRLGCSHGNFHWNKVGPNVEGGISGFGFGQAVIASPWRCAVRDLLGPWMGRRREEVSLLQRWPRVRGRAIGFVRRVKARLARELRRYLPRTGFVAPHDPHVSQSPFLQCARLQADPALNNLAEAWSLASLSRASAGSYYSLDVGGINFPGERPWILRWDRIRKHVDFTGKRLLDLGCNMGLLSIHAKLSGAASCLGVDAHKDILLAARLASRAFETEVEFRPLHLDDPSPWEDDLTGFDMVAALSVVNWVKDKARVWSFLAKQQEVLYEGHESGPEAERNLRWAGFTRILPLGSSERDRQMFYATRA